MRSVSKFIASVFTILAIAMATATINAVPVAASSAPATTRAVTVTLCPFCSAVALTFSEQLNSTDIAVVAELLEVPPPSDDPDADFPKAKFEIVGVLKGQNFVGESMTFKTQLVGSYPAGQKFLVMGVDPPDVAWTTPMKASDRVFEYLQAIQKLPESGPVRLTFFQDFFEDKEPVLAFDAYDEFARAPYEDLIAMKANMNRERLIGWIKNPETSVSRRRLYFTMLGVCGTDDDIELLEDLITSGSRKKRAGLDALIASYLTLKGNDGVDLIEKTFLADSEVDYVDTLAAVSALRFHGTEVEVISKDRIVKAVRHLLDRPKMADMIIPDLARWEDWAVMDQLVQMFKDADEDSNWLRVPVITYLRACPKPEAKQYIEELKKIDLESVQRADFFLGVGDSDDDWDSEPDWGSEPENTSDVTPEPAVEPETETNHADDPGEAKATGVGNVQSGEHLIARRIPLQEGTFATEKDAELAPESASESSFISVTTNTASPIGPTPPNQNQASVVSSMDSMAAQTAPALAAQSATPPAPVAAVTPDYNLTWSIIFVPMAISVVIFLLLWSIVNGWFERLIF